jgi:hypothetical protein
VTDEHRVGLLSRPHIHHRVPDDMPEAEVMDLRRWAYKHHGPRRAAVVLLDSHGMWLTRPEIRRHLVYVSNVPPGTPSEVFPTTAIAGELAAVPSAPPRSRFPYIELDWQAVDDDRRRGVFESIGEQQDQMIVNAALSIAIGHVGRLARRFSSYTTALVAAALLDVASVSADGRQAQALLEDFGKRERKLRGRQPARRPPDSR